MVYWIVTYVTICRLGAVLEQGQGTQLDEDQVKCCGCQMVGSTSIMICYIMLRSVTLCYDLL